jgi:hypothetical protein
MSQPDGKPLPSMLSFNYSLSGFPFASHLLLPDRISLFQEQPQHIPKTYDPKHSAEAPKSFTKEC